MNQLAKLASASIKINHTDHTCKVCQNVIPQYGLMIVGASKSNLTGYTGGHFHPVCWFLFNSHPINMEVYSMSKETYDTLDIPNLKPIGPMLEDLQQWDVTHSQLVNVELVVLKYDHIETQYGDALLADCLVKGEPKKVLIGGQVLIQQLVAISDQLPVLATIIKVGTYYTFS